MRNKNKEITLYNVLFPIWFLILFPITWIVVLPANFIIDSIVLLVSVKLLKLANLREIYKKSILKVWLVGFASDFVGAGILFLSTENNTGWSEYLNAVSWNPFDNWYAILFVGFAVTVSGICIYLGNIKYSLKAIEVEQKKKRILALTLAVITAPYILFYPSSLLHGNAWDDLKFMTNHIVKNNEFKLEVILNEYPSGSKKEDRIIMYSHQFAMKDAVNEAEKTSEIKDTIGKQPALTLLFYNRDYSGRKEIPVFLGEKQGYFTYENRWYVLDREKLKPFLNAIAEVQNTRGKQEFVLRPAPGTVLNENGDADLRDKDGKKESEYPVFEDSQNRYYCQGGPQQFDSVMIQFEGREREDLYNALESGLVTPQELIAHGMKLTIEPKNQENKERMIKNESIAGERKPE